MTVLDNVRVGSHPLGRSDFFSNALRLPWRGARSERSPSIAWELIDFLDLGAVAHAPRRRPAVRHCRSASSWRARWRREPKLLLLDEPAGGLNHTEVDGLGELIRRIRDERDITILLVEHHMSLVMSISRQGRGARLRPEDRRGHAGARCSTTRT